MELLTEGVLNDVINLNLHGSPGNWVTTITTMNWFRVSKIMLPFHPMRSFMDQSDKILLFLVTGSKKGLHMWKPVSFTIWSYSWLSFIFEVFFCFSFFHMTLRINFPSGPHRVTTLKHLLILTAFFPLL